METVCFQPIAHIETDFTEKFGIPRQSGLVDELRGRIVFEPAYRVREAFRGMEAFSHLWLLWVFSESLGKKWSPTVRPPRLGGNARMGVFATRSPFRPNPIGLSCVRLERVEEGAVGPVLHVRGADLLSGTPILDIKPYIPYADARPDASGGFTDRTAWRPLRVVVPGELAERLGEERLAALTGVLENDPRPSYQADPLRVYGMRFAGMEIRFRVDGEELTVLSAEDEERDALC